MSVTHPITNLGDISAHSIAYDTTKAAIALPQVTAADTFATLDAQQTLTNKTLTSPVIASLKQASSGGTINMPTVASGSTATLATTADVASAVPTNMVTTDTEQTITGAKQFRDRVTIAYEGLTVAAGEGVGSRVFELLKRSNANDYEQIRFVNNSRRC